MCNIIGSNVMKCLYHPKRNAVAILNKTIDKREEIPIILVTPKFVEFQIGLCLSCFNRWITKREKEGYEIGGVL